MNRMFCCVVAVFTLMFFTLHLSGQTSYGTIAGVVTDSTGSVVVAANVTVTSRQTGESHAATTTNNGGYRIEALGTGVYDVTVTGTGFAKTVVQAVTVNPSVITSVNAMLQVGQSQQTVDVSSSNEIMQTESGESSATIGTREISNLPISSMNPYSLATTLPGVTSVTAANFIGGASFSVNGSRPRANNFLIEGQDNNDAGIGGSGLTPINQEAVQSVTFLMNSAAAEFGHSGGAVSNLVYKSGTNQFHGAVWDRLYNSALNATDHGTKFNGGVKTKFRENVYGFRIGGPIKRDKLFFFASDEWEAYRATAHPGVLTIPTAAGYAVLNNLKSNPRIANLVQAYAGLTADPTTFTTFVRNYALGPDPVTGADRGTVQFGGYQRSVGSKTDTSDLAVKVDYLASDKDKLQVRFVRDPYLLPYDLGNNPNQLPHFDTEIVGISYNGGIVENHTFSSRIFNEFRLSYGRISYLFTPRPDSFSNPLIGPTVSITGITGYGIPSSYPTGRFHNTYQLQDALSIVKGNHSLKVGFDLAQIRVRDEVPWAYYGSISYVNETGGAGYSALANYADDYSGYTTANSASVSKNFGDPIARPYLTNQAYYAQDHWKVRSNLAIDLGLRYEYYGGPFNYLPYPAVDPSNFACFPCRVAEKPNFANFGPRFGFAYTPTASSKTVIRGGFGMFYDNVFSNIQDNVQSSAPNASSPVVFNNNLASPRGTPNWSTTFAALNPNPLITNSQNSIVPNLRNPLTYQWNFAIQQELPYAMSLTLGYVGSREEHLYAFSALNPLVPGLTTRINTTRAAVTVTDNSGDSEYEGATAELERKYRTGSAVRLSYTFAKALDDVSEIFSSGGFNAYPQVQAPFGGRGLDWGPSAYDHRQRAVLTTLYNTPVWQTSGYKKILAAVVNRYTIGSIVSFQTGNPYNVETGIDINGDGIASSDRPVLINKNAPINSFAILSTDFYTAAQGAAPGVYCDGTYFANALTNNPTTHANDSVCHPVALNSVRFFAGNRYHQNATIGRNAYYVPGLFSADATLERTFKIHEGHVINFRAECFNFLNHANTGTPGFTLSSSANQPVAPGYGTVTFGNYATSTSGARSLRFFMKYEF